MPDSRTVAPKAKPKTATRERATIGQIIFGLDDRNLARTLRLLEPAGNGSGSSSNPGRQEGSHCATCITRGE